MCNKLSFPDMQYTTSPQDINRFMEGVEGGVERLRILFSAYQSAREISEAGLKRMFSGSILDKTHETAATGKTRRGAKRRGRAKRRYVWKNI